MMMNNNHSPSPTLFPEPPYIQHVDPSGRIMLLLGSIISIIASALTFILVLISTAKENKRKIDMEVQEEMSTEGSLSSSSDGSDGICKVITRKLIKSWKWSRKLLKCYMKLNGYYLLGFRILFDIGLAATWITVTLLPSNDETIKNDCETTKGRVISFLTEMFMIGSELTFSCLSVLLVIITTNPFLPLDYALYISQFVILLISVLFATILISNNSLYGLSFIPCCWTKQTDDLSRENSSGLDIRAFFFFYFPWICAFTVSLICQARLAAFLAVSPKSSRIDVYFSRAQLNALKNARRFILAHGIYWGLLLCVYAPYVALSRKEKLSHNQDSYQQILYLSFCLLIGARGVENTLVVMYEIPSCFGLLFGYTEEKIYIQSQFGDSSSSSSAQQQQQPIRENMSPGGSTIENAVATSDPLSFHAVLQKKIIKVAIQGVTEFLMRGGVDFDTDRDDRRTLIIPYNYEGRSIREILLGSTETSSSSAPADATTTITTTNANNQANVDMTPLLSSAISSQPDINDPNYEAKVFAKASRKEFLNLVLNVLPFLLGCVVAAITFLSIAVKGGSDNNPETTRGAITALSITFAIATVVSLLVLYSWRISERKWRDERSFATVIEYAPRAFERLRNDILHCDANQLATSLKESLESSHFSDALKVSSGKSGSFMFYSNDQRYIIKTCSTSERDCFLRLLNPMIDYLTNNSNSSLARVYGIFGLKMMGQTIHLMIMENLLPQKLVRNRSSGSAGKIVELYDLKGSYVARTVKPPQVGKVYTCQMCGRSFVYGENKAKHNDSNECPFASKHIPRRLFKDNDFSTKVLLPATESEKLKNQLRNDVRFLCHHGIMDYSLLLGIHRKIISLRHNEEANGNTATNTEHNFRQVNALAGAVANEFYFGMIDYLQEYNWKKKAERFIKMSLLCDSEKDEDGFTGISCTDPDEYAERFIAKVINQVFPVFMVVQVWEESMNGKFEETFTLDVSPVQSLADFEDLLKTSHIVYENISFDNLQLDSSMHDLSTTISLNEDTWPDFMAQLKEVGIVRIFLR